MRIYLKWCIEIAFFRRGRYRYMVRHRNRRQLDCLSQQNNKTPFSRAWHRVYFEFESDWFIAEFSRNDWLDEIDT